LNPFFFLSSGDEKCELMLVALVQHVDKSVCLSTVIVSEGEVICDMCSAASWQSGIVCLDNHRGWRQLLCQVRSFGAIEKISRKQVATMYMIAKLPTTIWFDNSQTSEDKCNVICCELGITSAQALFKDFKSIALELLKSLNIPQGLPNFPFTKKRPKKVRKN
jgi:hypothetical protein